jgi:hypothetical protein
MAVDGTKRSCRFMTEAGAVVAYPVAGLGRDLTMAGDMDYDRIYIWLASRDSVRDVGLAGDCLPIRRRAGPFVLHYAHREQDL